MRLYIRAILAAGGLSIALTVAWTAAFVALAHKHVTMPALRATSLEAPAASREPRPPWHEPDYFVASEIGKSYHRPDCFYAAKQMKHGTKRFSTKQEAEAAGLKPCTNCIQNIAIAP